MIHKAARRTRRRRTPHATSRVRPQKRSGADWTHCLKLLRVAETRNEVRVRPQKRSGADWTHCLKLLRVAETRNEVRVRPQKRSGAD